MKKYILATLFLGLFTLFLEPAQTLLSNFLRIEQPTVHKIEDGDWLSKIALKYYGDPTFWKELELINRAPQGNLVFPGEKVIVPSFQVIQQIRDTKRLTDVNALIEEQQNILASNSAQRNRYLEAEKPQRVQTETIAANKSEEPETLTDFGQIVNIEQELAESGNAQTPLNSSMLLAGMVALGLGFVIAIFYFIRKKRKDEVSYYGAELDTEKPKPEESVYLDGFGENEAKYEESAESQTNAEQKKIQVV